MSDYDLLEFRHLKFIQAVGETHSFTAAAERVHTSQSNISTQIGTLEEFLEIELFHRDRDGVIPTPYGEVLMSCARDLLKEKRTEWESEVFVQKRRIAVAEEALAKKETKKAREDVRIGTAKSQALLERLADLRRTEPNNEDARIFPMMYAPVLVRENEKTIIRPMRYACRLAGKPADYDKRFPGTYNARRDSLDDYWSKIYGQHHAVLVISGFYENVPLHLYEHRELAPDEKPKNLVLEFDPQPSSDMLVACVWDRWTKPNEPDLYSFAAITDEPLPEVAATGHQRTIITLQERYLSDWLSPKSLSKQRIEEILSDKELPYYIHQIAA